MYKRHFKNQPFKTDRRQKTPSSASVAGPPLPPEKKEPEQGPLTRGYDPTGVNSDAIYGSHSDDPRDLASLLSWGPSFLPYTSAWTDNRIEQVRAFKNSVFVAVDRIASKISEQIPNVTWVRHEGKKGDPKKWVRPGLRSRALLPLLTHEQLEPVPWNHPLIRLLKDPNEPDTSYDLWYETILFLLLTGSTYWWIPKNELNLPSAIWVVPSHWMWPIMGKERMIEAYEIRPVEGNYLRRILPADEVIHFRKKNPVSKLDGYSPLTAGAQWADVQSSIYKAMWHSYRNGPLPTVAVQFDGKLNDPDEPTLRRIETKFLTRYSQEKNANTPIFLPPGVSLKPLTIVPNEMVFGETAAETRDNVYEAYGYFPGMREYRGKNVEGETALCSMTLNPLCRLLGQTITEKLAKAYPGDVRVWWEAFRVNDPAQVNEDFKTDMLGGAVTPSEMRVARGREPYTGEWEAFGNTPIVPVNMRPGSLPGGGEHNDTPPPSHDADQPTLNDDDSKVSPDQWYHL